MMATKIQRSTKRDTANKGGRSAAKGGRAGGKSGSGAGRRTTNHNVIRRWIESRGSTPAIVEDTQSKGKSVGLLRVDFPGYRGRDRLQHISWDEFFRTFDENDLEFLYQDKTATGRPSRFSKFVSKSSARS